MCAELHIGNTPRSIMTKGNSISKGTPYGNFIRGNDDKLMISYTRDPSHTYTMKGACGVIFEGEIHFFGSDTEPTDTGYDPNRQHFVIETTRSGTTVKMTKKDDLDIGFYKPSCSSFQLTSESFPWFQTNVVILCFDMYHRHSCYSFDGQLTYIVESNHAHWAGGLTKFKGNLLTVGDFVENQKTEILTLEESKNFSWSVIEPDFKFTQGENIYDHSLVTVESSEDNEEYVLLIGGIDDFYQSLKNVFKFNGTWSSFGQLNKPRYRQGSPNTV